MVDEGLKQKLTAILTADVKDYSRLLSQDRVSTIRALNDHREMFANFIQQYGGRVVDMPGDNILALLESVSDAVNCSVEIQRELAERNAEVPSARMMQWRIGVNLGDVVEEDGKVYGDGINIAARVEGLAEAGGICVSGRVYDQVHGKLGLEYESLGEQTVKNIASPIRIYRVLSYPGAAAHRVVKAKVDVKRRWRTATFAVVGVAVLCVVLVLVWNYAQRQDTPSIEAARPELTTPLEKPSIAVLPFENMSGDPEQEYFSDGMSEEIINGLAKNPELIVKGRTSSFSEKLRNQDIRTIAELLSVTHVVEGSVRRSGDRIRITAQLIETDEDAHIWSGKYDRELTDVFEIQDGIANEILKALDIHLLGSSGKQMRTMNMEAYNAYLLGCYHQGRSQYDEAIASFEEAVALEPDYADAYAQIARTHDLYVRWSANRPLKEDRQAIHGYIEKALSLNPDLGEALALKALLRSYEGFAYQDSIYELDRLVRKHPNDLYVLDCYASVFEMIDRNDLAIQIYDRITEIDPLSPEHAVDRGTVFLHTGQFDKARRAYETLDDIGATAAAVAHLSMLAFEMGDIKALRNQLDRGLSDWSGMAQQWHFFYRAAAHYLEGNQEQSLKILDSYAQTNRFIPALKNSYISLLEGDHNLALDYFSRAVSEAIPVAFRELHKPVFFGILLPEYRTHPKYQKMLRDVGLDAESIAKLKIPPLPF